MAALDFPAAPVNGQVFTGVGGVNWVWDGAKWNPGNSTSGGQFVPLAGGTMTGPLVLPGPPVSPLQAATKAYVDGFLPLGGGTLTGLLTLSGPPTAPLHATTKTYVDAVLPSAIQAPAVQNNVGRNLIHNPLFNVAQRGAGPFTVNGTYSADRWLLNSDTDTQSVTVATASDTDRSQIGDDACTQFLSNAFVGSAAGTAFNLIPQRIEGVRRLGGKTVTVSFYARIAAGTATRIGVAVDQFFGTGGSPSAPVFGNGQPVTLSATWQRYSLQFTVPSTAGKTLGTAGNDWTGVLFWCSCTSAAQAARSGNIGTQSGTIQLWGVQLEIGSTMTPLEKPDPQQDLAKCQRFFQVGSAGMSAYGGGTGWGYGQQLPFAVQMRATPTMAISASSGTNTTAYTVSGFTAQYYAPTVQAVAAGNYACNINWTATADL